MKKITDPAGPITHGAHNVFNRDVDAWWVDGVLYTDSPALIASFERHGGYTVEDAPDGPPAEYTERADKMRAEPTRRPARAMRDAQTPDARNYPHI